jgi:hypothetical protein
MEESIILICPTAPEKYFFLADWTDIIILIPANKLAWA